MSPEERPKAIAKVREEYRNMAESYARGQAEKSRTSLADARANKLKLDWAGYTPPKPSFLGTRSFKSYDLAELARYLDWTPFFHAWELKGTYPRILKDDKYGEAARHLFDDAQAMLKQLIAREMADRQRRGRLLARQQRRRRHRALHRRYPQEASRHAAHAAPADGPRRQRPRQSRAGRFRRAQGDRPRRLCRRLRRDRRHRRGGRGAAVRARQ